jgi:hypothetical protein
MQRFAAEGEQMDPKEYRQERCPHGWVHRGSCGACKNEAERDALRSTVEEQRRTIGALMVGMPEDGTTPVIRRIAALEKDAERWAHCKAHGFPAVGPQCMAWTFDGRQVFGDTPEGAVDNAMAYRLPDSASA